MGRLRTGTASDRMHPAVRDAIDRERARRSRTGVVKSLERRLRVPTTCGKCGQECIVTDGAPCPACGARLGG